MTAAACARVVPASSGPCSVLRWCFAALVPDSRQSLPVSPFDMRPSTLMLFARVHLHTHTVFALCFLVLFDIHTHTHTAAAGLPRARLRASGAGHLRRRRGADGGPESGSQPGYGRGSGAADRDDWRRGAGELRVGVGGWVGGCCMNGCFVDGCLVDGVGGRDGRAGGWMDAHPVGGSCGGRAGGDRGRGDCGVVGMQCLRACMRQAAACGLPTPLLQQVQRKLGEGLGNDNVNGLLGRSAAHDPAHAACLDRTPPTPAAYFATLVCTNLCNTPTPPNPPQPNPNPPHPNAHLPRHPTIHPLVRAVTCTATRWMACWSGAAPHPT